MRLGYGLLSGQRAPGDDRSWRDVYAETLDLAEEADRLGFDSVWTTEHHFVDDGYMPSLLVTSAALAARTERIAIATGVLLAPLHHPLRLAEDAATVQLLADGRLVLGLGLGWSRVEFSAFDADRTMRGRAMDEILPILRAAWSGHPLDHHGEVYDLEEVAVRPTPHVPIPIVIGGSAEPAIRRAARLADGFLSNASPEGFAEQVAIATDEMEAVDRDPSTFSWRCYQYVWIGDDAVSAWDEALPHLVASRWKYSDMEASAVRGPGPLPEPPEPDEAAVESLRGRTLVGTAEQVAEGIRAIQEAAGVDIDFVSRSHFPGMSYAEQHEQLVRQAEELAPLLA
ncbi:MAG: LLM class flavin-dependent oxidoreductase [Acidimicrobiia bacterium]|nr:LLM class flavin-dependent oxidoreductase [Acidimicrobiia bacterium]